MKELTAFVAALAIMATPLAAMANPLDDRDCAGKLREFIKTYLDRHRDLTFPADPGTTVAIAKTSLGPKDPGGYVIYIKSGGWCGSGGCHTLIVSKVGARFETLGFICCMNLPISVNTPLGNVTEFGALVRTADHSGMWQATLTRRGDAYDFYQPQRDLGSNRFVPLITEGTSAVPLY